MDRSAIMRAFIYLTRFVDPAESIHVIHGAARGADELAGIVATELGCHVTPYPAQWDRLGKQAGFRRNEQMLLEKPNVVIAFKSNLDTSLQRGGTEHMMRIALAAQHRVKWCNGSSIRDVYLPGEVI